jgi:hypothetical protein
MQEQMAKKIGSLEANKAELTKKLEEKEADIVKLKIEKEQLKRMTDMEVRRSPGRPSHPAAAAALGKPGWRAATVPLCEISLCDVCAVHVCVLVDSCWGTASNLCRVATTCEQSVGVWWCGEHEPLSLGRTGGSPLTPPVGCRLY